MTAPTLRRATAWVVFATSLGLLVVSFFMNVLLSRRPDVGDIAFNVLFTALPVTGILIARRQPGNRIAWILLAVGMIIGVGAVLDPYARFGLAVHPGSLPAASAAAAISGSLWVPAIGITGTFLLLLFPDGRLPSPRWRPVGWASGLTIALLTFTFVFAPGTFEDYPGVANPLGMRAVAPLLRVVLAVIPVLPLCMLACALSLVMRFRRSRGIERLQVKWLAGGAGVTASVYLLMMLLSWYYNLTSETSPQWLERLSNLSVLTFLAIPAAIGIAVLRYGLYGIDRLISRTLSYALITGTLLVIYLLLVTTVSHFFPKSNSSFAVAASTLTVAALFQPLRRRVQAVVDRRFNRARYDADRTVEAFTKTLRSEVNLDAVSGDLIATVHETLEPAAIGLWLRPSRGPS